MTATKKRPLTLDEQKLLSASILDIVQRNPGLTVPEIQERAAVPNRMVRTSLHWLAIHGMVRFCRRKLYWPTWKAADAT